MLNSVEWVFYDKTEQRVLLFCVHILSDRQVFITACGFLLCRLHPGYFKSKQNYRHVGGRKKIGTQENLYLAKIRRYYLSRG